MEIREIEAFLVLAEELHFGRAAERLGISQGRISQLIQALERRIGGQLAERTSRNVRLTELGEQFAKDARAGYELLHGSITSAQADAARDHGTLRVGVSRLTSIPVVAELCEAFEHRFPLWKIQRVTINGQQMWTPLYHGDVDVCFGRLPCPPEAMPGHPGITLGPIAATEDRVVLMAEDHPLAGRSGVSVEELPRYAVVRWGGALPAWFKDAWLPRVTPLGEPIPRGDETAVETEEFYDQIARRGLLHLAPASALETTPWPRVVAVPLTGLPPFHIVLARLSDRDSSAARALFTMVADLGAAGAA